MEKLAKGYETVLSFIKFSNYTYKKHYEKWESQNDAQINTRIF
jgi:hypothetical protein